MGTIHRMRTTRSCSLGLQGAWVPCQACGWVRRAQVALRGGPWVSGMRASGQSIPAFVPAVLNLFYQRSASPHRL